MNERKADPGGGRNDALRALDSRTFDVLVVGGGILGACVARDAAIRGLSTALVERADFGAGTSANSLKVIHGGLRHLQHLDLGEFRRSVAERRTWLRIAPHLVEPLPVLVPFTTRREGMLLRAGLAVNDLLSAGRNRGVSRERHLPGGRVLGREEAVARLGTLATGCMRGAALYHDALMYSAEHLVLEMLASAREHGAVTLNHVECTGALADRGIRTGVLAKDRLSDADIPIAARSIVNACGPWAGSVEARVLGDGHDVNPPLSLAWNLVVPSMGLPAAVALPGGAPTPTGSGGSRPRRLFMVPWQGCTLVGTGHAPFTGDPAAFRGLAPEDPEIVSFLDEVNAAMPGEPIVAGQTLRIHSGLLPALPSGRDGRIRLRRRSEIRVNSAGGGAPLVTASTVKFTAARRVAEEAVDRLAQCLDVRLPPSLTASTPLPSAPDEGMEALVRGAHEELSDILAPDEIDHLVRTHGSRWREVVAWRDVDPTWSERPAADVPVLRAQLLHGAHRELAATPEDLIHRHIEAGARVPGGDALLSEARAILGGS